MKGFVCTRPGLIETIELPDPIPAAGQAILKIRRVNVCGTDLHAFEGTQPFFNYPRILGHEIAAELVVADGADGFSPGDAVTIIPYFNCFTCLACRNGQSNCCAQIKVCGVHIDGAMVSYFSVPSYSLVHHQGIATEQLAMIEPLAIGAHGIRRAAVREGEFVLVMGAGPIGLGAMEFARIAGARVIAMDVLPHKLAYAKEQMNIEFAVNATSPNALDEIRSITNGDMVSVVIDATGSQKAINNGLQWLGHGGRYVLIGLQKAELIFSHPEFHKRETTLMSSRNATRADFNQVVAAIQQQLIDPSKYISKIVDAALVPQEFSGWIHPHEPMIKVAINFSS
jgi:2-desacetyl-2-hydroxyethyl bacteriochlorophyllide A dehydrogenase